MHRRNLSFSVSQRVFVPSLRLLVWQFLLNRHFMFCVTSWMVHRAEHCERGHCRYYVTCHYCSCLVLSPRFVVSRISLTRLINFSPGVLGNRPYLMTTAGMVSIKDLLDVRSGELIRKAGLFCCTLDIESTVGRVVLSQSSHSASVRQGCFAALQSLYGASASSCGCAGSRRVVSCQLLNQLWSNS